MRSQMSRLDIYKIVALLLLEFLGMTFFIFAILTNDSGFFKCAFCVHILIASVRVFIGLQIVINMEKTGEFFLQLDLANNMLQYVSLILVTFSISIYCGIEVLKMVT